MLPSANQPAAVDPIYALAAIIDQQRRGVPVQRAFAQPGQGVVPMPGQPPAPPIADPGQLSVPGEFNPGFPSAPPPQPAPPPMPSFPGKERDDLDSRTAQPTAMAAQMPAGPVSAAPQAPVAPDLMAAAQDQPGPLGRMLPSGARNGIVDALAALGGLNSNANPLQALGQTFGAGMASKQAREDRKAGLAGAQYDREHQLYREQVGDTRAAASDTREEKRLTIDERKAATEERRSQLQDIQIAAGIEHTQAETSKIEREYSKGGLTTDQMLKVENQVTNYGKTLIPSGSIQAPDADTTARVKKSMDDYRKQLIQQLTSGTAAPSEPGAEVPKTSGAGEGTWDAPVTFPAGTTDLRSAVEKLPKGTIFVGPSGEKMERQ